MPDTRTHRGPHPEDDRLFGAESLDRLCAAVVDLSWLLSRDYASAGAIKLVGDHYQLDARQRTAVSRAACSDEAAARRAATRIEAPELRGRPLAIDGYNVLTTLEAALGGGVILAARDGTFRDMASMHGSYRKVAETRPALERLGRMLADLGVVSCRWYLDRPVSNSARLRQFMATLAAASGWPWQVDLVADPDALLVESPDPIATADSAILDSGRPWFNLARETILHHVPEFHLVDLSSSAAQRSRSPGERGA